MDKDDKELTNRLFATATAMLEDAVEIAVAGQSPRLGPAQLLDHGRKLRAATNDIAVIAEAAAIIAGRGIDEPQI